MPADHRARSQNMSLRDVGLWFVALPSAIVLVAHGIELFGLVQLAGEIKSHDTPFVPSKFQRYCARWLGTLHNVHATNVTNLARQMEDCDLFEAAWKRLDAQWLGSPVAAGLIISAFVLVVKLSAAGAKRLHRLLPQELPARLAATKQVTSAEAEASHARFLWSLPDDGFEQRAYASIKWLFVVPASASVELWDSGVWNCNGPTTWILCLSLSCDQLLRADSRP